MSFCVTKEGKYLLYLSPVSKTDLKSAVDKIAFDGPDAAVLSFRSE